MFSKLMVEPQVDSPSPVCFDTPLIVLLISCPMVGLSYPSVWRYSSIDHQPFLEQCCLR